MEFAPTELLMYSNRTDDDLIECYLRGELAGPALEAFELRLLSEPELLTRSEGLAAFRAAIQRHPEQLRVRRSRLDESVKNFLRAFLRPRVALAVAAICAVVAVSVPTILVPQLRHAHSDMEAVVNERDTLRRQLESMLSPAVPHVFEIPVSRGTESTPDLTIVVPASDTPSIALLLPLPAAAQETYRVALSNDAGTPILDRPETRPNLGGQILLVVPAARLAVGDYRLLVAGKDASWTYRLRVVSAQ